ncbi:MAG: hypothetical protein Q7S73_02645 [bacterium]|nr:hypothetical protein [bacterium]
MDDTIDTGFGSVSFLSQRLFGRAVVTLYVNHHKTLKKLVRYCKQEKWSSSNLTYREVQFLQKIRILDASENVNDEARTVILSMAYLKKDGAVELRKAYQ